MILKQYYLGCLSHASYLIGDEGSQIAAVVDPQRDIDQYLDDARSLGLQIRHVFLTHFHADFVAGHLELRDRVGARIYMGAHARPDYEFTPLREGDTVQLGQVRLQIREAPGHTPEGILILVYDLASNPARPYAVLTGDTLFIGDVGRPDLLASTGHSAAELAGMLYDSLQDKLLTLPDETLVYPAHGAGSMCGKNLSKETVSTLGQQRRSNYALQPRSRNEFIQLLTRDLPEVPAYFAHDARLNQRNRPTLEQTLKSVLRPLALEDVLRLAGQEAQLLDVRPAADFAGGHLEGSLNIGLDGKFATWVGTLLDPARPIVILADPGREAEAAMRLGRIGFDYIAGFLSGGAAALQARPDLIRRTERITAAELRRQLTMPEPPLVVDVRSASEWQEHHIDGSVNFPLPHLRQRASELPSDRELVIQCAGGYRSSTAASLLAPLGIKRMTDLVGGIAAWDKEVGPTQAASTELVSTTNRRPDIRLESIG
jgi:hydroxyacylglutathione hydrolase